LCLVVILICDNIATRTKFCRLQQHGDPD
jgi:hypothetical protein